MSTVILESVLTCPRCGFAKAEVMPTDACQFYYECGNCKALQQTGRKFTLPTEAQWEYACRAGTDSPLSYGDCPSDFGRLANLADQRLTNLCRRDSPKWIPCIGEVNDGATVTNDVGQYPPNAWGLCDMHGNAPEWTRTAYRPYPYEAGDGRDDPAPDGTKSVRGGSFYDRPHRARSAFRQSYRAWQRASTVGFRVAMKIED